MSEEGRTWHIVKSAFRPNREEGERLPHPFRAFGLALPFFEWRLAQLTRRYPVHVALAIASGVAALLLVLVLVALHQDRNNTHAIRDAVHKIQVERQRTTVLFCVSLNHAGQTNDRQNQYIAGLIISGTKASKPFERLLRQLGAPPYRERLKLARKQASGLKQTQPPPLNCNKVRAQVNTKIPAG